MKKHYLFLIVAMVAAMFEAPAVIGQEYQRRVAPTTREQFLREQGQQEEAERKKQEEEEAKKQRERREREAAEKAQPPSPQPTQPQAPAVWPRVLMLVLGFLALVGAIVGYLIWKRRQEQEEEEPEEQRRRREAALRAAQEEQARAAERRRSEAAQPPPPQAPQPTPELPQPPPAGGAGGQGTPGGPAGGGQEGPAAGGAAGGGPAAAGGAAAIAFAILWLVFGFAADLTAKDRIVSITPNSGVQGDKWSRGLRVEIRCKPTCGDVTSMNAAAKGVAVDHITPVYGQGNAVYTAMVHVADDAAAGPKEFWLTRRDGSVVDSQPVYFYVFTKDVAGGVDYLEQERLAALQKAASTTADPAARHFLQALFQAVYGQEEGNEKYVSFRRNPSHEVVQELLANYHQQVLDAIPASPPPSQDVAKATQALEESERRVVAALSAVETKVADLESEVLGKAKTYTNDRLEVLQARLNSVEQTAKDANEVTRALAADAGNKAEAALDGAIAIGQEVESLADRKIRQGSIIPLIPGRAKSVLSEQQRQAVANALARLKAARGGTIQAPAALERR